MQQLRQVLWIMGCRFDTLFYDAVQHNFYEQITKKGVTHYRLLPWREMKQQYKPKKSNHFAVIYKNAYVTIKPIPVTNGIERNPYLRKDEASPIGVKIRNPTADWLRLSNRDWVKIRDSPTMVQFGDRVGDPAAQMYKREKMYPPGSDPDEERIEELTRYDNARCYVNEHYHDNAQYYVDEHYYDKKTDTEDPK
jgi:hypothetical protein